MATLIVGGDKIESIREALFAQGETDIAHWIGRKHGDKKSIIPKNTQRILLITNYVNHGLADKIKKAAKRQNIPIEYTRNSRCYLEA